MIRQEFRLIEPLARSFAQVLFAIGIIGAGFLAVPILASSTAYAFAETMGWRDSLSYKVHRAKGFYTVITMAILVGVLLAFLDINPIKALFYSQVLNGIFGPFLLILIILLFDKKSQLRHFGKRLTRYNTNHNTTLRKLDSKKISEMLVVFDSGDFKNSQILTYSQIFS